MNIGDFITPLGRSALTPTTLPAGGPAAAQPGAAEAAAAAATGQPLDAATLAQRAEAKVGEEAFKQECETCKNRRYVDGSDDPGVSFQTPQRVDPGSAPSVVLSHEMEHVSNEQARARQDDRSVVFQNVVLHSAICPECGRSYIAGGETTTVTAANPERVAEEYEVGKPEEDAPGHKMDEEA